MHASGRPDETGSGRTGTAALARASGRPMVNQRPTMRDVATAAGVSLMTVSRVTVVAQDPITIGATAAQLLFGRIAGDTSPARQAVLLTRLVVRGSGEIAPIAT